MKDFKEYLENSKLLELTLKVWNVFTELQLEENKTVGIREFDITFKGIYKNRFNIVRIRENERTEFYTDERLSVIDITVGNAVNLSFELCYLVYEFSENQKENFQNLASYIHSVLNENESVIDFLNSYGKSNYEKLIGYLYFANDEELTANLAGFYVPHLLEKSELKESDYYKELKQIYNDMKKFSCNQKKIDEILATDKVKGLISQHLSDNGLKNSLNSDTLKSLIKEINIQGEKFVNIYEGLLEN